MTHFSIPSFSQNEISELHTSNEKYTLKILNTGQRSVSTKRRVKKNKNKNKNVPHCSLWLMAVIAAFVCTDNYPSVASSWVQQVSKQRSGNMDGKYISLIFQFTRILNCTTSSAILCVSSSPPPFVSCLFTILHHPPWTLCQLPPPQPPQRTDASNRQTASSTSRHCLSTAWRKSVFFPSVL